MSRPCRALAVTATAVALALGACVDSDLEVVSRVGPTTTTTTSVTVQEAAVGEPLVTRSGNFVSVRQIDGPFAVQDEEAVRVIAAEVEACAAQSADAGEERRTGVAPGAFRLDLEGGQAREPVPLSGVREPLLEATELEPGECVSGWLTFAIEVDEQVTGVTLTAASSMATWNAS